MEKSDSDINEAVARKLGIVPIHMHDPEPGQLWGPKKECFCAIPDYCHSIKAAWEILDTWYGDWKLNRFNKTYCCDLFRPSEELNGLGDTAPMAICRAFLKLP